MIKRLYKQVVIALSVLKSIPGLIKIKKMNSDNTTKKKLLVMEATKKISSRIMNATSADIVVNGLDNIPNNETALYISNHLAVYDIPLLVKIIPDQIGFIAKIELKKVPIINSWITEMNGLFLDRENKKQSLITIKEAIEKLKNGHSLVIFPQGTREKEEIIPFKGGSFSIARNANVPIVPVAISGTNNIFKQNSKSNITVTFLNKKYISKADNINDVAHTVENEIRQEIERQKVLIKK
jgi:1-acyl-sn-glycerol-3-phosphate acyltransferase